MAARLRSRAGGKPNPAESYRKAASNSMAITWLDLRRVAGLDVSIFNPRLDPDGALANRLAALIGGSVASVPNVL